MNRLCGHHYGILEKNFSTQNRENRVKDLSLLLILMCCDIETCPGPNSCLSCKKTIRRNQSSINCSDCQKKFHLKCFDESDNVGVCSRCYCLARMAPTDVTIQDGQGGLCELTILNGLSKFVKEKGMKLLHQNICGLVAKLSHVEYILKSFKDITYAHPK